MSDEVVLDLGEYGSILIESDEVRAKGSVIPASRKPGEKLKLIAGEMLRMPLTGLGKLFMATLPEPKNTPPAVNASTKRSSSSGR